MTLVNHFKNMFCRLAWRFYIPPELLDTSEIKIAHISDTPTRLYPALKSLLSELNPEVIIHTGDLADDIKLEINPESIYEYSCAVAPFLQSLEDLPAKEVYIIPGNHDNYRVIDSCTERSSLVSEGDIITVHGINLGVAHYISKLPEYGQYNLYGHNFSQGDEAHLNGLNNVNIILCPSGQVVKIPYPLAVNNERKMETVYGIPRTV
ncbi:MAG: metallophosphoesterase [Clostridiales bacterium]|nr:metallophosphoesterase [Clostridiales bacterium]MCF8021889.1 metallophosphoesterase [Clostridiales bacterium]